MDSFDPYHKWLGITKADQPADHYRLLGIEVFESDPETIQAAADRQMAYIQKCANGPFLKFSQRILNELAAARVCLLNPVKRKAYDLQLRRRQEVQEEAAGETSLIGVETEIELFDFETCSGDYSLIQPASVQRSPKQSIPWGLMGAAGFFVCVVVAWLFVRTTPPEPSQTIAKVETRQANPTPVREKEREPSPAANAASVQPAAEPGQLPLAAVAAAPEKPAQDQSLVQSEMMEESPKTGLDTSLASLTPAETPRASESVASTPPKVASEETEKKPKPVASAKPKAPAKKSNVKSADIAVQEFLSPPLASIARKDDDLIQDIDATSGGQARLTELCRRASTANQECVVVARERMPMVKERQVIAVEVQPRQVAMLEAEAIVKQLDGKLEALKDRPRFNVVGDPLNAAEDKMRETRNEWNSVYETNKNEIASRVTRIEELSLSISNLDERMRKSWEELNDCRRQWLEICRPQEKYARADFEGAVRVIEEWVRVDELWLDVLCWGALASYELNDVGRSGKMVELAEKLRTEVLPTQRPAALAEAALSLVSLQLPGQRTKSAAIIQKALSHVDKDRDWQTYFIVARAYQDAGRQDGKAKAYFERSLKIDQNNVPASYWLGRLQSTSTDKSVRDIDAGIQLLETAWEETGKSSWRISASLVQAYDAAKRTDKAKQQWELTLKLAPAEMHEEIKKQRAQ